MLPKRFVVVLIIGLFCCGLLNAGELVEVVSGEGQYSRASVEPAKMGEQAGVLVSFKGSDDLHFYAVKENSPGGMFNLQVTPSADGVTWGEAVFPKWKEFYDSGLQKNVEVYVGDFEVFVPVKTGGSGTKDVTVTIAGIACTSKVCLAPFEVTAEAEIDFSQFKNWKTVEFETVEPADIKAATEDTSVEGKFGTGIMLLLAVLGGLSFNIMPCVLPVIPIIIMRLIDQSKESGSKRIGLGFAFCGGIILFFTAFAIVAAVIKMATGSVISMNDYLRQPGIAAGMFLVVLVFGLFMFDVFQIGIPASVASKSGSGSGAIGSIGMGFFAAVLSIPCTGAILAFVLVWAQTKTAMISVLTFMLMGIGMALPYALLVLFPALLNKVPKPGTWMENFRKMMGFLLIFIAVKLMLPSLPKEQLLNVLKYAVVLSFCVWMWGCWVGFMTPKGKKLAVRLTAAAIAVIVGFVMLPVKTAIIDWADYDQARINLAVEEETPVLIKFTADWCTNCKVLDRNVFQDKDIADLLEDKGVFAVKGDTTTNDMPATIGLKEFFGKPGNVPITILMLPDGAKNELVGIYKKEELIAILDTLPDAEK